MVRIKLLFLLVASSLISNAQLGLVLNVEQNSLSNTLRARGLADIFIKNEFPDPSIEAYFGAGDEPFSFQHYQNISLEFFDSIPGQSHWGYEFTNFIEAYAKHSLFNMLYFGNQVQTTASLDDLHIKRYQVSNLTYSKHYLANQKNTQLKLKYKLGLVHNYLLLKNETGSIQNRNEGQEIYLDYDYQLYNSYKSISGLNLGVDLHLSHFRDKWTYALQLKDVGLMLLSDLNELARTGDTSYQGVDFIGLLSGEEQAGIDEYFLNGDTLNSIQFSSAQVFAEANRKIQNAMLDEVGVFYRSYSIHGNIHSIGLSLLKKFSEHSSLQAQFATGSLSPVEIGLSFSWKMGKHKFLLGSKQVMAPILPTFSPGIQFTLQYHLLP